MKTQKGITMTSLVTSIIVLILIASIATYAGMQAFTDAKVEAFADKMKVIQKKVDLISQEFLTWNGAGGATGTLSDANFKSYLASKGFQTLHDSGGLHATNLRKVINDVKPQNITDTTQYYYFSLETIKSQLGVETLSDSNFYIAVYFANPNDQTKRNYVVEEEGVRIKSGNVTKTYHDYYNLSGT